MAKAGRMSREALSKYPLTYSSTYQANGHKLSTYDLEKDVSRFLAFAERPGLIYSDPPWGGANASTFRTKAQVEGKAKIDVLNQNIGRVASKFGVPMVIEGGVRWQESVLAEIGKFYPVSAVTVEGTYYKKSPMVYHIFISNPELRAKVASALQGMDDDHAPGIVMDLVLPKKSTVMDVVCGRGLTAEHALRRGHRFIGNELAPFRAARTFEILTEWPNHPSGW